MVGEHLVCRLEDDQQIAKTEAERSILARVILKAARGFDLLAFGLPDTHLHLGTAGRGGAELARRVQIGLGKALDLPARFVPVRPRPVLTQWHLERMVTYILEQQVHVSLAERSWMWLALAAALVGCGPVGPPRVARQQRSIIDGQLETGFPSVVKLSMGCTATLVGYQTLLTAAHCVEDLGSDPYPAGFEHDGVYYEPSSVAIHPAYAWPDHDLAVVHLKQPPPIQPTPISSAALDLMSKVALVGFGLEDADDPNSGGVKRSAQKKVMWKSDTMLSYVGGVLGLTNICFGDSGGPAFDIDRRSSCVAGNQRCTVRASWRGSSGLVT